MDWSKYPLEKLVYFVAALIPGFAALLTFELAHPGSFNWFFALGFLGYRTKIALAVMVAFVIGYSMSSVFGALLGGIGGAIGAGLKIRHLLDSPIAPWRDPLWRYALSLHLGAKTPEDTMIMLPEVYQWKLNLINEMPEANRLSETANLNMEKIRLEMNDRRWSQWYDHFAAVVRAKRNLEWFTQVRHGIDFNLKTAAVYVLVSLIWVPALRHWWIFTPAILWTIILIIVEITTVAEYKNPWSTLNAQTTHLMETKPGSQQASLFAGGVA
jgi:hypothetical protein